LNNAPTWSSNSAVGNYSLDFEADSGTNSYISVSDDPSLDISGDFSVSFWYNATVAQADSTQIIGQYSTGDGFSIYANSDGDLAFQVDGDSRAFNTQYVSGFINDGNWHHVVATRDGDQFQIYVDNAANFAITQAVGTVTSTQPMLIGGTNSQDYEGKLDDVRIYSRALTSSDVTELYATKTSPPDITTGLILHNTFDIDASDSSGNSYDGALESQASVDTAAGTNKIGAGKLSLDGTSDHVDLSAHVDHFENLTQGTVAAWVYLDSLAGEHMIFESSDSSDFDSRFSVSIWQSDLHLYIRESGSPIIEALSVTPITKETWTHIAVTVDPAGNAMYINGIEQAVEYPTGAASGSEFLDDVNDLDYLGWGIDKYNGNQLAADFNGFIDDGRVYDRALSSADVAELFNYTVPQTYTVTNTLDDGSTGSLRWAISQANAHAGADTIDFNITGSGTQILLMKCLLMGHRKLAGPNSLFYLL